MFVEDCVVLVFIFCFVLRLVFLDEISAAFLGVSGYSGVLFNNLDKISAAKALPAIVNPFKTRLFLVILSRAPRER